LPRHLKPSLYDLKLRINVYERVFTGVCSIRFTCYKSISFVVIHADTNIQFASDTTYVPVIRELQRDGSSTPLKVKAMTYNPFYSYFVIELDDERYFRKGVEYQILFENYNSTITNNLKGIYFSTYTAKNQTRYFPICDRGLPIVLLIDHFPTKKNYCRVSTAAT
jgi:hypothetical protein